MRKEPRRLADFRPFVNPPAPGAERRRGRKFDPDYVPYQNCASKTAGALAPAIVSFGPNGVGPNMYDCDDVFYELR